MGDPQKDLDFIHIAGTNGKGSVGAFISSILRCSGVRVGHYSSPAVFTDMEIIRVNNVNITKKDYDSYMEEIERICDETEDPGLVPTEFERQTALAFKYFKDRKCDIVILECGMGGETDATNVIDDPIECIFTSISMDHMQYLGGSLHKIAETKAGIIKPGALVYTSNTDETIVSAIKEKAEDCGCEVNITKTDKKLGKHISLQGDYQLVNASLAVEAAKGINGRKLKTGNTVFISDRQIEKGLHNTKWPGRFELINQKPDIIIDGAHNPGAADALKEALDSKYKGKKDLIFVVGMLNDKDHDGVLSALIKEAVHVLCVSTFGPRGMNASLLSEAASRYNGSVTSIGGVFEAMDMALMLAGKNSVIVVCGTLSIEKEVKKWKDTRLS
ncbi:MAG: bifunctional folylpolyglutamate synthase/dihydrofolate synthase [Lachnospiraceae bacterium]|nr:bifunctional folylpolyglutamate synthase/dihydrofolate synthase [Lachnospiraceae bacterium]